MCSLLDLPDAADLGNTADTADLHVVFFNHSLMSYILIPLRMPSSLCPASSRASKIGGLSGL